MKLNNQKQIQKLADELRLPYWQIHKAIFELNSVDDSVIRKHFDKDNFRSRLKETLQRAEELKMYIIQCRLIPAEEFTKMNIRISHIKEDIKSYIDDYADLKPNVIGNINDFYRINSELLLQGNIDIGSFLVKFDIFLGELKKRA